MKRFACLLVVLGLSSASAGASGDGVRARVAFIGLHGGAFDTLQHASRALGIRADYLPDERFEEGELDLSPYDAVVIQHLRRGLRHRYLQVFRAARRSNPRVRLLSLSGAARRTLPELVADGTIDEDEELAAYYGTSRENLRRLVAFLAVRRLGLEASGDVLPPEEVARAGLYHPDHEGLFDDGRSFLEWERARGRVAEDAPLAVVAVHWTHLQLQQPKVVDALVRALEGHGMRAVAVVDGRGWETLLDGLRPDVVVHTCHSRDPIASRIALDVPHMHSLFFRKQSIDEWRKSPIGLAPGEKALQIVSQELLGAIEPLAGAGTKSGGGSAEAFEPIEDRIERIAQRASRWVALRRKRNADKRVAVIYWDREMGKGELMRGSATGMYLNAPQSLLAVLRRMKEEGYGVDPLPGDEDELLGWMMDHGRQVGIWAPETLDALARGGEAVLLPVERYLRWYRRRVPKELRDPLEKMWGPPPGEFSVWEKDGERFFVIPRVDLGNVQLLPQPLRGEAQDPSRVHDRTVPPPHNYLATYFWLEEEFGVDALVHFGTHGTEFMLPGKDTALSEYDWPDVLLGDVPNVQPWVINNLGESSPERRRALAVLVDHLVPPSVDAELSDELAKIHADIDKWITLEEGALKEAFRRQLTEEVRREHLDVDLEFDLSDGRSLSDDEIRRLLAYLHEIHNESTPVSLHVLGEPPPDETRLPYLVICLRRAFLDALGDVVEVPPEESLSPGDREKFLRRAALEAVRLHLRRGFDAEEALRAAGAVFPEGRAPKKLLDGLALAKQIDEGLDRAPDEIDGILRALAGRFVPPGQGGAPDRNPSVVPTGRNLYVMNPEEVPSKPSWEIGKRLVDRMLASFKEREGRWPERIAFTLNSFATFQDYGVMESQILYLVGVRPVWTQRGLVVDVEPIPLEELGRPRIDVFVSALGYYRDTLPSRMRLIDRAIRLVADLEEGDDNGVRRHSVAVERELAEQGYAEDVAARLARSRLFGRPPGVYGDASYYYLVERSGEWDTREDLVEKYLEGTCNAYTQEGWIEDVRPAYAAHVRGTDLLLRSWSDRTRSPLSNKYVWYKGGSLSLAIKHLTGKEPRFFLSDVRDPDAAKMVDAEKALRRDFRVRLFNRKWIEGMMKEGYAGADQIAVHVSNTMGWKIMRENSVDDDIFEKITDIYLRDEKQLGIREWFEEENPFAFQEVTEILLECIRKGYWDADLETRREIARAYAESVAEHGEGEGLRGGGNEKLHRFVRDLLEAAPGPTAEAAPDDGGGPAAEPDAVAEPAPAPAPDVAMAKEREEVVEGKPLVPRAEDSDSHPRLLPLGLAFSALLLVLLGFLFRIGAPRS